MSRFLAIVIIIFCSKIYSVELRYQQVYSNKVNQHRIKEKTKNHLIQNIVSKLTIQQRRMISDKFEFINPNNIQIDTELVNILRKNVIVTSTSEDDSVIIHARIPEIFYQTSIKKFSSEKQKTIDCLVNKYKLEKNTTIAIGTLLRALDESLSCMKALDNFELINEAIIAFKDNLIITHPLSFETTEDISKIKIAVYLDEDRIKFFSDIPIIFTINGKKVKQKTNSSGEVIQYIHTQRNKTKITYLVNLSPALKVNKLRHHREIVKIFKGIKLEAKLKISKLGPINLNFKFNQEDLVYANMIKEVFRKLGYTFENNRTTQTLALEFNVINSGKNRFSAFFAEGNMKILLTNNQNNKLWTTEKMVIFSTSSSENAIRNLKKTLTKKMINEIDPK